MNKVLLKKLSETAAIAGREDALRALVKKELGPYVDSMKVDGMGNLIGFKRGKGKRSVMLAAHMDEIGFIVKHVDKRGFLRLQPLGGFDPRQLFAQRVLVHPRRGKALRGVLTYSTKPAHLLSPEEARQVPKLDLFFVDLGMSAAAVKKVVEVGDMVTMDRSLEFCGEMCVGKAIDNRVGVYVMLEAMKALGSHEVDIYAVATVQEEVGLRGATTSSFHLAPDVGVAIDTTIAADIPGGGSEAEAVTRLGDGAAIKVMDSSQLCHPKLVDHFREIAKRKKVKHQMEILPRGGTDGGALQRSRGGIPCVTLSIPTRYIHTVNEMAHVKDVEATVKLLTAYLEEAHTGKYGF